MSESDDQVAEDKAPWLAPYRFKRGEARTRAMARKGTLAAQEARRLTAGVREDAQAAIREGIGILGELIGQLWEKLERLIANNEEPSEKDLDRMLALLAERRALTSRALPSETKWEGTLDVDVPVFDDPELRQSLVAVGEAIMERRRLRAAAPARGLPTPEGDTQAPAVEAESPPAAGRRDP